MEWGFTPFGSFDTWRMLTRKPEGIHTMRQDRRRDPASTTVAGHVREVFSQAESEVRAPGKQSATNEGRSHIKSDQ